MLTKRLNVPFEMCSMYDPAFDDMDDDQLKSYIVTRDMEKLKLESLEKQPTVFICKPLQQEYEHLPEHSITSSQDTSWLIFKTHVDEVKNFMDENGRNVVKFKSNADGNRTVDDKCRKDIPMGIVQEVALVIVQKAVKGDYSPFMLPQSYFRDRIKLRMHRALSAKIETASE